MISLFIIFLMIQPLWNLIILSISYIILIHYVTSEIEIIELVEIQLAEKFLSFDLNSHINPVSKQRQTNYNGKRNDFLWSKPDFQPWLWANDSKFDCRQARRLKRHLTPSYKMDSLVGFSHLPTDDENNRQILDMLIRLE